MPSPTKRLDLTDDELAILEAALQTTIDLHTAKFLRFDRTGHELLLHKVSKLLIQNP
jgi:hypothetical protein